MDGSTPKKLIALILVGVILAAAAAWMATQDRSAATGPVASESSVASDPLKSEFERCQLLGEAGAQDPACLSAWAENRRRFLAPDRRPSAPNPGAASAVPTER
jgi:conjugative transfer region protein TrbK